MYVSDIIEINNLKAFVIDETFNTEEYSKIINECLFLCSPNKLLPPELTAAAKDNKGELKKSNKALFLNEAYKNQDISDILTYGKKIINKDLFDFFAENDYFYKIASSCRDVFTLLSYYEKSDYYKPHTDNATITFITWVYQEPKAFNGGELILNHNKSIECVTNRTVIFPSFIKHEVTPVLMEEEKLNQKMGRFTISQFFQIPY